MVKSVVAVAMLSMFVGNIAFVGSNLPTVAEILSPIVSDVATGQLELEGFSTCLPLGS